MSRHKFVKGLILDDELDDYDGLDDLGMSQDDQDSLDKATVEVRKVLGDGVVVSDTEIKDTLWHYYFDVSKSITWLLDNHTSQGGPKPKAKKKKGGARPNLEEAKTLNGANGNSPMCRKPFDAVEFFSDSPWLNIPKARQALIIIEPLHPPGGLLGGAPPKQSKLAALAVARRKKEEESKVQSAGLTKGNDQTESSSSSLSQKLVTRPTAAVISGAKSSTSKEQASPRQSRVVEDGKRIREIQGQTVIGQPASISAKTGNNQQQHQSLTGPSPFAATIFSNNAPASNSNVSRSNANMFSLPYNAGSDSAKVFSFLDPSPDDIVVKAQRSRKRDVDSSKITGNIQDMTIKPPSPPPKSKSKNLDVLDEHSKTKHKKAANFVVIGHVDAGKSTLMGRLLYDLGAIDARTIERYKKEAAAIGKKSFAFAWVLDQQSEERERGVTIDIASNDFETQETHFTILDAPGHKDFVPNMIAGASQADFAVLVLDASTNSFEAGLRGQTREHAMLVRSIGVQKLVVAINKLDTVDWSEARFHEIQQQTSAFLSSAGFSPDKVSYIPCSGLHGNNIITASPPELLSWYKGETLLDALETSEPTTYALTKPLRLTIGDVFRGGMNNPNSISGRVEAGSVQFGDRILTMPSRETATVRGIEVDNVPADWAVAGANVILHLDDVDPAHLVTGDVICTPNDPAAVASEMVVKILAFDVVFPNLVEVLKGRLQVAGQVAKLIATLDKATSAVVKKKPRIVKPGEVARVKVTLDRPIAVEKGAKIIIRAEGETLAAGLVE
ncbi:MAG: Hsp70 suppressor, GTPase facilitates ribosomal subunit dissociation [Vezdaea aestivalis]|nr:MAG: Hsp70 suppressor, GTPase facilitates ribosomal subunit dissociation [Vezdaea aestivalis]